MFAILQTTLTRLPWRWRHLVSAAKVSAISYGKNMEIYEEALELLHAQPRPAAIALPIDTSISSPLALARG